MWVSPNSRTYITRGTHAQAHTTWFVRPGGCGLPGLAIVAFVGAAGFGSPGLAIVAFDERASCGLRGLAITGRV